jgi:hypothetical protein
MGNGIDESDFSGRFHFKSRANCADDYGNASNVSAIRWGIGRRDFRGRRAGLAFARRRVMVKRIAFLSLALVGLANTGCIMNQYSSDPRTRAEQLMNQSEDIRQIEGTWRRFWFNDMPSHLTPERIDGGIMK